MRTLFIAVDSEHDQGFIQASFGKSSDTKEYFLTTNHLHADEVPEEMHDAKDSCELVAKLLNEHFDKVFAEEINSVYERREKLREESDIQKLKNFDKVYRT